MAFEDISSWQENEVDSGSISLPTQDIDGLYICLSKALTFLGSANAQYKVQRRKLDKLNPQISSLTSEPFPEQEKNLFGPSLEEKVKKRNETVKILLEAAHGKSTMHFFSERDLLPIQARSRGQFPDRRLNHHPGFPTRGRSSYFRGGGWSRGKSPAAQLGQNYVSPQSFQ